MNGTISRFGQQAFWWFVSVGLFVGVWEATYAMGLYSATFLPPPHIFVPDFPAQAMNFDFGTRLPGMEELGAGPLMAVILTTFATMKRVVIGLALGFCLGVLTGIAIRYVTVFGRLTLPTLTLLAPISPFAWLPVAVNLVGLGDPSAIFLVFVTVYFLIVLATIAEIDGVPQTYHNVARIMGADRWQLYRHVILPAILPGLFVILRLNMFAAWMVALIAESGGAESGLGAVVMLARATANTNLVFLGIFVIGVIGFLFDVVLRWAQRRLLYWLPATQASLQK